MQRLTTRATTLAAIALTALSLAAGGCDDAAKPATGEAPAAEAQPMSDADLEKAALPVKVDFEEQAATTITSDTLDAQLDALAQEITSDKSD